jgi:hypothetical protein
MDLADPSGLEALTLSSASKSDGQWRMTFEANAVYLERTDQPVVQRITVRREAFFRELEYREWLGLLVILHPKRLGLRLSDDDRKRLRNWLGVPTPAEIAHVIGIRLKGALVGNLLLLALFVLYNREVVWLTVGAVGLANTLAARLRPRTWHLVVDCGVWVASAAYCGWRLWTHQTYSVLVEIVLIASFLASAQLSWRAYRMLAAARGASTPSSG